MRNDIKNLTEDLINWISEWFELNGPLSCAVIGISGGKDSTIVAKLCCEAIGPERVIGVLMPNGVQHDIEDSKRVVDLLGISSLTINIEDTVKALEKSVEDSFLDNGGLSKRAKVNIPPRVRMATLYAVSQTYGGRVSNNCNLSENFVGYSTIFGDMAGDFSPLHNLTVTEILEIGDYLGLPYDLVHKTPIDGLNFKDDGTCVTDEDNLGVTYAEIDDFILNGGINLSWDVYEKIQEMHEMTSFKRNPIAAYEAKA